MATIRKPPIPAKLYRHFAVATVGITFALAMLADGSRREAMAEAGADIAAGAEAQAEASRREIGNASLTRRDGSGPASTIDSESYFDNDSGTFGAPMMTPANSGATFSPDAAGTGRGSRPAIPGYRQAYLDGLSDAEYEALVEGLREAGMLDAEQRAEQVAALERASMERSGRPTVD